MPSSEIAEYPESAEPNGPSGRWGGKVFHPYLGVLGGYTDFSEDLDGAYNYGGVLGFDIGLTKNGLVLTTAVRYSVTDTDSASNPGTSVPYDPLVYQLGLGWRF